MLDGTEPPKHEYRFVVLFLQDIFKAGEEVVGCHGESNLTMQTREVCHIETSKIEGDYKNSYRIYFLSDPFKLNDYVGTINLPFGSTVNFQECMLCGWGYGTKVTTPLHRAIKMASCNEGPTVICTEGGPC
ncbi:unnamed protein product, partial [Allacma fusca]